MDKDLLVNGKPLISASQASEKLGYSQDYIGQLARSGKVNGKLIGRTWYVDVAELENHKRNSKVGKPKNRPGSQTQTAERKESVIRYEAEQAQGLPTFTRTPFKFPVTELEVARMAVGALAGFTFIASAGLVAANIAPNFGIRFDDAVQRGLGMEDRIFGTITDTLVAQTEKFERLVAYAEDEEALSLSSIGSGIYNFFAALFDSEEPAVADQTPVTAPVNVVTTQPVVPQVVYEIIDKTVVENRTAYYPDPKLAAEIEDLRSKFASLRFLGVQTNVVYDSFEEGLENLDTLGDLTLTDTLTGIDALFSSDLEVEGLFTFANATGTNATTTNLFANYGTITDLIFTSATGTSATTTNLFSTTASSTNLFSSSASLGSLSFTSAVGTSATTTNLFSTTASSTNLFSTSAGVGNLSLGALTSGLTITGNDADITFTGTGNHDIIASSGTLRIGSNVIIGNIEAVDDTIDIGTPGVRFDTIYADEVNASTIVGTLTGGNLTAETFTINSDNATADAEDAFIAFERGSASPNALIGWDSTNDEFDFSFGINVSGNATVTNATTSNLYVSGFLGIGTSTPQVPLHVGGTSAIGIPYGTTGQRPTGVTGLLRFNTSSNSFEGFNGSAWSGLGGVIDVDQNTYIVAESSSGANEDTLFFFTGGSERMRLDNAGRLGLGTSTPQWLFQLATSTRPQLTLSDGSATSDHWTFRNTGGNLYIAEAAPGTFATSSTAALTLDNNGVVIAGTRVLGPQSSSASAVVFGYSASTGIHFNSGNVNMAVNGSDIANFNPFGLHNYIAGNATTPSYSWNSDTNTGFFNPTGDVIGVSTAGSEVARFTSTGLQLTGSTTLQNFTFVNATGTNATTTRLYSNLIKAASGAFGSPSYTFDGDENTGFYRSNPDTLSLVAGGSNIINISSQIEFRPSGSTRWTMDTSGHFLAGTDNTVDVGASGANRPRSIYTGTSFVAPDGSLTAPSYTFSSDTNTGLKWDAADTFSAVAGGTEIAEFSNANGLIIRNDRNIFNGDGSASQPSYNFANGGNTGLFQVSQSLGISTQGVERMRFDIGGRTGIGTSTPRWLLQLATSTSPQLTLSDPSTLTNNHWTFRNSGGILYLATSSPSTFATSTTAALTLDTNGRVNAGLGFLAPSGSASAPSYKFATGSGGMYEFGGGLPAFAAYNGTRAFYIDAGPKIVLDVALNLSSGTVGAPPIHFAGDSDTGLFSPGSDRIQLVTGGTARFEVDSTGVLVTGSTTLQNFTFVSATGTSIRIGDGSESLPSVSFSNDPDTGIYSNGTNSLTVSTGGSRRLIINSNPQLIFSGGQNAALPDYTFLNDQNTGMYRIDADRLGFSTAGVGRWEVNSSGHLMAITDNTYDIGSSSGGRPRAIVVGTSGFQGSHTTASIPTYTFVSDTDTGLFNDSGPTNSFGAAAGGVEVARFSIGGIGIGTTTPRWSLQVASSTRPQLTLSDPSTLTNNHWSFRNAGGSFYLATSSPSTFATSTTAMFSIDTNGFTTLGNGLRISNGSQSVPSLSFSSDTDTGIFNAGDGIRFVVNGNQLFHVNSGGASNFSGSSVVYFPDGSVSAPAIAFNNDPNTGIYRPASDEFSFVTGGAERARITGGGYFGIGTSSPQWALQIASSSRSQLTLSDGSLTSSHWSFRNAGGNFYLTTSSASTFATSTTNAFYISGSNGNVGIGIGTSTPGEKLEVVGNIISKGTEWTSRTSAADNGWIDVAYGNGTFVAVAFSGTGNRVMTSPDGVNWTSRTSAADISWENVTYGNGLFVAVATTGTGNRVMTSPDGVNWTSRTSAADNTWRGVTYGNGLFVAVGSGASTVMTSPDGINWTLRTGASDHNWQEVAYANGLFVAVGNSGDGSRVMTSPDGLTWTLRTAAASNDWQDITYGNGLFVAIAQDGTSRVMTSPDGITWTGRTAAASNNWHSVTYGNGLFVAVATTGTGDRVMTSPDGITWTSRTSPADNFWNAVTYGNGIFVAVGYSGSGNRVMTSGKQDIYDLAHNNIVTGPRSLMGFVGIGTTTPQWMLQIATTSGPQLTLSDSGSLTFNHWSFRNAGGLLYIATSSPSTFATSTYTALAINSNGGVMLGTTTAATSTDTLTVSGSISNLVNNDFKPKFMGSTPLHTTFINGSGPMHVVGKYIYVPGSGLRILDVSTSSPVLIGTVHTGDDMSSVYVAGKYAYMTNTTANALNVVDISNPGSPVIVATSTTSGATPKAVKVSGQYAYLLSSTNNWLEIFDISSSTAPVRKGRINTNLSQPQDLAISGKYAYVPSYSNNLLAVFDVSNPDNIVAVGTVSTGTNTNPRSIDVSGRYAYVGNNTGAFQIYDVSNPSAIVQLASTTAGTIGTNSVSVVQASGRYVYLLNTAPISIQIFDVSNPTSPVSVSSITNPLSTMDRMTVSGRYIYAAGNGVPPRLQVFDQGGIEATALIAHSLEASNLNVRDDITAQGQLNIAGGINTGQGGIFSAGDISTLGGINAGFRVGIGTTTPKWALQISTSTAPQLTLSDASTLTNNHWSFRNAGGNFYLATSSASTFATTSLNALVISGSTGNVGIGVGTSTPGEKLEVVGNIISKGTEWTSRTSASDLSWIDVAYGNGLFVAVATDTGTNSIMTSPDGINWTARTHPSTSSLWSVTYGNGLFIAVANGGSGPYTLTSPDGITWSAVSTSDLGGAGITYGNGKFVAVKESGSPAVTYSFNGINWTNVFPSPSGAWRDVTYGNGLFVAVAQSGTNRIMTSPDGITWTARGSNTETLLEVDYANGLFVAVGTTGQIYTSPDGTTWTQRTSPTAYNWGGLAYGNGLWVAVSSSGTGNRVITSPDGITWTLRASAANNNWASLTYGNGMFVAVSTNGSGNRVMTSGKPDLFNLAHNNQYNGTTSFTGITAFGTTTPDNASILSVGTSTSNLLSVNRNSGFVGIGTTTPSERLSVVGSVSNLLSSANGPTLIAGSLTSSTDPRDVLVVGNYAYVTNWNGLGNVAVIDVSDPRYAKLVSTFSSGGGDPWQLAVSGKYLFILDHNNGSLQVKDISNPASVTDVASNLFSNTNNGLSRMTLSGKYLYTTSNIQNLFRIFDVSNPTSVFLVSSTTETTTSVDVAVSGNYAYVVGGTSNNLRVYDITNPYTPVLKSTTSISGSPMEIKVVGRYAYVLAQTSNTLQVIDISNPASPLAMGSVSTTGTSAYNLFVTGRYAIGTFQSGPGFEVFDVASSSAPALVFTSGVNAPTTGIYISGRYMYLTDTSFNRLGIYDLSGTETTSLLAHSADIGNLRVRNDIIMQGQLHVANGAHFGTGGIFSVGPLAVHAATTANTRPLATFMGGYVGIGTTTPKWALQVTSTSSPQLTLSDPSSLSNNHWSFSNAGGNFHLATSSSATFSTSTVSVLHVNTNGRVGIGMEASTTQLSVAGQSGKGIRIQGAIAPGLEFYDTVSNGFIRNWVIVPTYASQDPGTLSFAVSNTQGGDPYSAGTEVLQMSANGLATVNGALSTPSYSFINDADSGFFNNTTSGFLEIVDEGSTVLQASQTSARFVNGSAGTPGISFIEDTNTGLFRPSGDHLAFAANGSEVMRIATSSVGIATTSPWRTFAVGGSVAFSGLTGSTGAGSICATASGELTYNVGSDACLSSTRATKHDITNLDVDGLSLINALESVSFLYNDGDGRVRYGFIAEDAADIDLHFATYNSLGEITGIDDRALISVAVKSIKELNQKFEERMALVELNLANASTSLSISTTTSGFIESVLEAIGATIEDGVLKIKKLALELLDADEVRADKLCVGNTCVTEEEFLDLLDDSDVSPVVVGDSDPEPSESGGTDPEPEPEETASSTPDTATSTPETTEGDPAPEPEPETTPEPEGETVTEPATEPAPEGETVVEETTGSETETSGDPTQTEEANSDPDPAPEGETETP